MTASTPVLRRRVIAAASTLLMALGFALIPVAPASADGLISGNLVIAGTSTPVTGEAVFLYREVSPGDFVFVTADTSASPTGTFSFGSQVDGDYRLGWSSASGYVEGHIDFSVGGSDVTHTDVQLQPASNISGQISNLGSYSGTGIYAWAEDINNGYSTASSITAVAADGTFTLSGISASGEYALYFQTPADLPFFDSYFETGLDAPDGPEGVVTIAAVGDNVTGFDVELVGAGIITGVISSAGTPISNAYVNAYDAASDVNYYAPTGTGSDGVYYIKVPTGADYQVYAWASGYFDLTYLNHLGCGCVYDPVTATVGQFTPDINFDLPFGDDWLDIETYALVNGGNDFLVGDVNIYRQVTGGFSLVATEEVTDDSVLYLSQTAGNYRLRFKDSTTWYAIDGDYYFDDYIDDGYLTPTNRCYIDIAGMSRGDSARVEASLVPDPSCGPEPAIVITGGGGTKQYRAGTAPSVTPVPTATPTPTPTASPTSEPESTDQASTPAPTIASEPAAFDLGWLLWLLIILAAIGVAILAVFLFRRR